jgi:hypothetical protein
MASAMLGNHILLSGNYAVVETEPATQMNNFWSEAVNA